MFGPYGGIMTQPKRLDKHHVWNSPPALSARVFGVKDRVRTRLGSLQMWNRSRQACAEGGHHSTLCPWLSRPPAHVAPGHDLMVHTLTIRLMCPIWTA